MRVSLSLAPTALFCVLFEKTSRRHVSSIGTSARGSSDSDDVEDDKDDDDDDDDGDDDGDASRSSGS